MVTIHRPLSYEPSSNYMHIDASDIAMGSALNQRDDDNKEYAVDYQSKVFKGAERHMSISEKELAAIIMGVKANAHLLYGKKFKIVTDHSALQYLMTLKNPTGRLARWTIFLSQFDYEIVHRKGKKHCNADYLSRPVLMIEHREPESEDQVVKITDPWEDAALMYYLRKKKFKRGSAKKQIKRILNLSKSYDLDDETLYIIRKGTKLEVPKKEDRKSVVDKYHAMSAHLGVNSIFDFFLIGGCYMFYHKII